MGKRGGVGRGGNPLLTSPYSVLTVFPLVTPHFCDIISTGICTLCVKYSQEGATVRKVV